MLSDQELGRAYRELVATEAQLRQMIASGGEAIEIDAARVTLRLLVPMRIAVEKWISGRAMRRAS